MNDAWGGGIWPGTVFTIQGAPGAGKSSLGPQIAAHLATHYGSKIYVMAPDEGTRAVCVRLGQTAGIDRDGLEWTKAEAIERLENAYAQGLVNTCDADADEAVIETFIDQICEEYDPRRDPPPVLYGDSIQTVHTDMDETFDGDTTRAIYVMDVLRAATRRIPLIAILISHVTRARYASKKKDEHVDPMAAAAQAIQITRNSDTMLDLSGKLLSPEGVAAHLFKNRLHRGAVPETRLRYDVPRGNFVEMDPEELEKYSVEQADDRMKARTEAAERKRQRAREARRDRIERLVGRRPGKFSKNALYKEIGGNREDVFELIDGLSDPTGIHSLDVDDDGLYRLAEKKGAS